MRDYLHIYFSQQGKPDFSLTKMKHVALALLVASAFIGAALAKDCTMVPDLLKAKFGDIGLAAGDCLNDIVSTVTK